MARGKRGEQNQIGESMGIYRQSMEVPSGNNWQKMVAHIWNMRTKIGL